MRTGDPEPTRVAETIARLDSTADAPLNTYWLSLAGDRNAYAARLQPLLLDRGIGVLIVRSSGFTNANALMLDLVGLLERNRPEFLAVLAHPRPDPHRIGVVLLARRELEIGQGYSPVTWPDWVPGVGNLEITCFITDVTRRIEAPLDADEIDITRVHRAVFALEEALVRRLVAVHRRGPAQQQPFFNRIRRRSDPDWSAFLAGAVEAVDEVRTTDSYRPNVKNGKSVVSRLWDLAQNNSPRMLVGVDAELATALGATGGPVPAEPWEGLMAVLARTPGSHGSPPERLCRTILLAVPAACQFLTCVAHAEDYQQFPVNLLTAVVDDLYRTLVGAETFLNHLSDDRATPGVPPLRPGESDESI
ncbi:hypothetical protein [Saccharothrix hoggarensis]|uniref:TIR domain-containing protein n=1 Tax=Saccharothrix hoggarensis TaxID=913853 RepID=A0ABW3QKR8_9PSEU